MTSFIAERKEERGRRAGNDSMVVVDGERKAREAQWGKLSGRGDAISAAAEGRGTGKPEGRKAHAGQSGAQVSMGRKALAAPSHACAGQRASRMGRKRGWQEQR